MPLRCLRRNPDVPEVDEVQSASMSQRLVSSPTGSGGEPLPVESTLAKMASRALCRKPHTFPMLMGRKELLRTVATQAFGKFTLRPIECHQSQITACAGFRILALLRMLRRHQTRCNYIRGLPKSRKSVGTHSIRV